MLSEKIQQKLQKNWGEKSDSLQCNVECRIYDPSSKWEWFLYAQNPNDPDEICYISHECVLDIITMGSLMALQTLFNRHGEFMELDREFKPRNAASLWQHLRNRYPHEIIRDS